MTPAPATPPTEFRLGDRLRLRKVHPCGGWTWKIARLGADIGMVCETCGRRVMIERSTLERRVKTFLERGAESTTPPAINIADPATAPPISSFTCHLLGLKTGDILEATRDLEVGVSFFYTTSTDTGLGKVQCGERVKVSETPDPDSTTLLVEPTAYAEFEARFVPGGVRTQESYTGYAISAQCVDLARHFRLIPTEQ